MRRQLKKSLTASQTVMLLTTQLIAAPKCLNEKQQADLSKYIKKCEQTDLDLAYQKEMAAISASTYEPPTSPLLLMGFGILLGSVATALIVSGQK